MKTLTILFILGIVSHGSAADAPPNKPGRGRVETPIGRLGYPIGTYLTIEGTQEDGFKRGVHTLLVDTISGYKLDEPVTLWIDNLTLPEGERCILNGYESGRWIGIPDGVPGAELVQAGWQFRFHFIVKSVDQPKSLKIFQARE